MVCAGPVAAFRPRGRATAGLARHEHIHLEPRFSDHVPPVIDCDFKLEA